MSAIARAAILLEFANCDRKPVHVCPVYSFHPNFGTSVPMPRMRTILAAAMNTRNLLVSNGQLPKWASPASTNETDAAKDLISWCKPTDGRGKIVPVLLVDEIHELSKQSIEVQQWLEEFLQSVGETAWPGIVRVTGTWSQTASYLYKGKPQS